jgi:uncharacterized protein
MKYLILLVVVLAVLWYWRKARGADAPPGGGTRSAAGKAPPQDMVQCPVCSVHLPRADALPGPDGRLYCCAAHRLRAQDQ